MNKGKTTYKFQINSDPVTINGIITEWLKENKFHFEHKYGEDLYYHYDAWYGNRGFQYSINGNEVIIYAWTIGLGKKFYMLDSGALNNMAGDGYKQILSGLFDRINNASMSASASTTGDQMNGSAPVQNISQVANDLKNETTDKSELLCEVGFWLSIVGLLLSFFGYGYGVIVYIIVFYLASQGLKTKKRTKAIISIILAILSIIILLGWIVLSWMIV